MVRFMRSAWPLVPWMIGLGRLVCDAIFDADAIEDVLTEPGAGGAVAVLGQIGEGHAVVGEHGVDFVGKGRHDISEKLCSVHLTRLFEGLDIGELGDAVDREEHVELALGVLEFANVDMDIADRRLGEFATLGGLLEHHPRLSSCGSQAVKTHRKVTPKSTRLMG
jgi:hypothetical protein